MAHISAGISQDQVDITRDLAGMVQIPIAAIRTLPRKARPAAKAGKGNSAYSDALTYRNLKTEIGGYEQVINILKLTSVKRI